MMNRHVWIALVPMVMALAGVCRSARAGSEIPSYDARTAGMGGAGITTTRGAAAIVNNPALLVTSGAAEITVDTFFLDAATDTPVLGPNRQLSSSLVDPVGFVGAALRINRRLVLAIAAEPLGAGASYTLPNAGQLTSQFIGVSSEIGGAYAITDRFSIGASWRPSYFHYSLTTPSPTAADAGASTRIDLSHVTPLAGSVGMYFRTDKEGSVGVFYRSRVSTDLTGTAITPGGSFAARSHYALPDKVGVGVDRTFLDQRLLVTAQAELNLFGALDGTTTTTLQTPGGPQSQSMINDNKTTWGGKVGGELWVVPQRLALRAGVWFGPQEGRQEHASYFTPYYGFLAFPSVGLGVKVAHIDIDAVMNWQIKTGVRTDASDNGNAGSYSSWAFIPGVGASYHF